MEHIYLNHNYKKSTLYKKINNIDEAKKIVFSESLISCLILYKGSSNYFNYEIIECKDKICIERTLLVFENIIKFIKYFDIDIIEDTYIFHYKGNACTLGDFEYKLLASSRKINMNNIILFPTFFLFKSSIIKTPEYHHDAFYYQNNDIFNVSWEEKKNVFFFRGINSGNPFSSIKLNWNLERTSRVDLFLEYLKLPLNLKTLCNISFDRFYPNKDILTKIIEDKIDFAELFKKEDWLLNDNKTIDDLKDETKLLLDNLSEHILLEEILKNKFLFCLEGFDTSSIINIAMISQSVIIAPKFYYENTIINSEYLEPYVHYIPINEDYSNLQDIIVWCLENDDKCKEIAQNAYEYGKFFLNENNMLNFMKELIIEILT